MLTVHGLCWLCKMPLALPAWGVCSRCAKTLFSKMCGCPQCGLPSTSAETPCGRCLQKPPPWQRMVAVNDYCPPLSQMVHRFKFRGQAELAPTLARLLLLAVLKQSGLPPPDRLISVPLWQRRHWRRGFNQSELLCQALSAWLPCEYDSQTVIRIRPTATQHELNARLRRHNLRNAFQLEFSVQGRHMVIVDDVVTTGSTAAEISRLLLRNGAASVQVWCLCRTL
ncbi:DNA utilization protein GntX [Kluyvera sp. STS39-E]|uniref:DNA utilization protein GntX n=1 Tax=Kluyvera sp. STS39-E TaxID=3234748 RepID=UPI0034C6CBD2